jgi:Fungal specific transcription factor domain
MAILTRFATSMSLQPTSKSLKRYPISEYEERRRCFWAIFLLDRFLSVSTGWPISLSELDNQSTLPCLETEFQMSRQYPAKHFMEDTLTSEHIDLWAFCVESAEILGRVTESLRGQNSPKRENPMALGAVLQEWWSRLPEKIKSPENVGKDEIGCLILIHTTYNTYIFFHESTNFSALILLHESLSFNHCSGFEGHVVSTDSAHRALAAAGAIARIFGNPAYLIPYISPLVPLSIFVALRYLLVATEVNQRNSVVDENVSILKRTLSQLAIHFPVAGTTISKLDLH